MFTQISKQKKKTKGTNLKNPSFKISQDQSNKALVFFTVPGTYSFTPQIQYVPKR